MTHYERLSGLDACFLGFETRNAYMHVAVTAVFEAGPLGRRGGAIDLDRLRRHFEARVPLIPRFRQRLCHLPVLGDAVWVDDDGFDLRRHLRHASLPQPGSVEQLRTRCAEILERPLDRRRPLWEIWIIEGLAGGRFALVAKVHHCIVDGIAGIGMLAALLDLDADAETPPPEPWRPRSVPTTAELLRDEVVRRARGATEMGRAVGRVLGEPRQAAGRLGAAAGSLWRLVSTGLASPPEVRFNRPIGPHRDVAWTSVDLATVKQVAHGLGGTVNDVVLTMVSGAIGATLRDLAEPIPVDPLRVLVPVSVRRAEELGAGGNRVSLWLVPLPVAERDARSRFDRIRAATEALKRGGEAAGGTIVTEAANWAGGAVVETLARVVGSTRVCNLIVTNVPGPPMPLYLAGARMVEAYPHLPLFEQQGLGIALLSYCGRLAICLVADWDLGGALAGVMRRLESGLDEVAAAVGVPVVRPVPRASRLRRRSPVATLVRRPA
jgi:diacylglycerol O-acyltransferase